MAGVKNIHVTGKANHVTVTAIHVSANTIHSTMILKAINEEGKKKRENNLEQGRGHSYQKLSTDE